MSVPNKISGFTITDPKAWSQGKKAEFEPKPFKDNDVMIEIDCCSLCGSDQHVASAGWGPLLRPDLVVGHEIVGKVIKAGPAVTKFKEGDRIGVGPICNSCGECEMCKADNESHCRKVVGTYNTVDHFSDNYVTQGGFASHVTVSERFAAKIPDSMTNEQAAPFLCAGLTVFSPLYRRNVKDKVVGVIGIGGLGHFALQFAKAMGAKKVVAISRSSVKKDDALKLGADEFIATKEDADWNSKYDHSFDLILNCATSFSGIELDKIINIIKPDGTLCVLGVPDADELVHLHAFQLIVSGVNLVGSACGSNKEMNIMLQFGAEHNIKPWIECMEASEENYQKAFTKLDNGEPRYRIVLNEFGKFFSK